MVVVFDIGAFVLQLEQVVRIPIRSSAQKLVMEAFKNTRS